jgi:hypothetical protein
MPAAAENGIPDPDGLRFRHGIRGGSGAAGLPEEPPWPFPSGGGLMDRLVSDAEPQVPALRLGHWDGTAFAWDMARGISRAARGEDDPRVRCATSRAALALARYPGSLEAAAALAAGAAESFARPPDASGGGEAAPDGPLPDEKKFALAVLTAARAGLAARPGRAPGTPFPAPAYRLATALHPGPASPAPARPGTAELRAELAEAERYGAGSAEALAARSRLGEAAAEEEALARAAATSLAFWCEPGSKARLAASGGLPDSESCGSCGDAGDSGDSPSPDGAPKAETALGLLRSASRGLDALLGQTHPDSLDARERLAACLAGFAGPGLPPDPLGWELPLRPDMTEAMDIFMETAAARAEASARAGPPAPGGPSPERGGGRLPPDMERSAGLLRNTADERALAAAAAAADCASIMGFTAEQDSFFAAAGEAALALLGKDHPVSLKLQAQRYQSLRKKGDLGSAEYGMRDMAFRQARRLGASSRETAACLLRLGTVEMALRDLVPAACSFSDALEAFYDACPRRSPSPVDGPSRKGLPPGRAGRDILAASVSLAKCLFRLDEPALASAVLVPSTDSVPDLPAPDPDRPPSGWPWPPELAGWALCLAGAAADRLEDPARGETLLRRSLELLGPDPERKEYLSDSLELLSELLSRRGDGASSREAAQLAERNAELMFRHEGPDSPLALHYLVRAADCLEAAGDPEAAVGLHRKVLAARKRLLGPMDEATRKSRAEIRRIGEKLH